MVWFRVLIPYWQSKWTLCDILQQRVGSKLLNPQLVQVRRSRARIPANPGPRPCFFFMELEQAKVKCLAPWFCFTTKASRIANIMVPYSSLLAIVSYTEGIHEIYLIYIYIYVYVCIYIYRVYIYIECIYIYTHPT